MAGVLAGYTTWTENACGSESQLPGYAAWPGNACGYEARLAGYAACPGNASVKKSQLAGYAGGEVVVAAVFEKGLSEVYKAMEVL